MNKTVFENVIKRGDYNLTKLLENINKYHIEGNLSDEERDELIVLARNGANSNYSIDVLAKLYEMDSRLKKLEETVSNTGDNTGDATEEYPDYVVGKWYYNGDKCSFNGEKYSCIAPEGVVCTWSPNEYPPYWEKR